LSRHALRACAPRVARRQVPPRGAAAATPPRRRRKGRRRTSAAAHASPPSCAGSSVDYRPARGGSLRGTAAAGAGARGNSGRQRPPGKPPRGTPRSTCLSLYARARARKGCKLAGCLSAVLAIRATATSPGRSTLCRLIFVRLHECRAVEPDQAALRLTAALKDGHRSAMLIRAEPGLLPL